MASTIAAKLIQVQLHCTAADDLTAVSDWSTNEAMSKLGCYPGQRDQQRVPRILCSLDLPGGVSPARMPL